MAFRYYRIGANTPSDIVLPISPESYEAYEKSTGVYQLARSGIDSVGSTMRLSNFLAREKGGTLLGYYKMAAEGAIGLDIGLDKAKLLPQVPSSTALPAVKIPVINLAKNTMLDIFLRAKAQATRAYGIYPGIVDSTGKSVPLTTPAMVIDTYQFLFKHLRKARQTVDITGDKRRLDAANDVLKRSLLFFNRAMGLADVKVSPFNLEYIRLLKTSVLPANLVKAFWDNARGISIQLESIKGRTAFTEFRLLGVSFYERAQELVKQIPKAGEGFLKAIKTLLIVVAVLLGGFLVLKVFELARAV